MAIQTVITYSLLFLKDGRQCNHFPSPFETITNEPNKERFGGTPTIQPVKGNSITTCNKPIVSSFTFVEPFHLKTIPTESLCIISFVDHF